MIRFGTVCVFFLTVVGLAQQPLKQKVHLPIFTEEREAAAMVFVRKHRPEIMKMLVHLKKENRAHYERTIRDLFRTSEHFANLKQHDPEQAKIALKTWQLQAHGQQLAAQLSHNPENGGQLRKELEETIKQVMEQKLALSTHRIMREKQKLALATKQLKLKKAKLPQLVQEEIKKIEEAIKKHQRRIKKSEEPIKSIPKPLSP